MTVENFLFLQVHFVLEDCHGRVVYLDHFSNFINILDVCFTTVINQYLTHSLLNNLLHLLLLQTSWV